MPEEKDENKPEAGHLTEEQMEKATQWFVERLGDEKGCPMCGNTKWHVGGFVEIGQRLNLLSGGRAYPSVPLICINCGNTVLFNAVAMGLIGDAEPSGKGGQDNG
jgi:hypothetical protein